MNQILKQQVETIVNPLNAFEDRKARYREELLAHLIGLLAEVGEGGEAEALRRFGDPAAIRRELQETVPLWERVAGFQLGFNSPVERRSRLWQAPGEPPLRFGFRIAGYLALLQIVAAPVVMLLVSLFMAMPSDYLTRTLTISAPLPVALFLSGAPLVAFGVLRGSRSAVLGWGGLLSGWLFTVMYTFTLVQEALGRLSFTPEQVAMMAATALVAPPISRFVARMNSLESSRIARWRDMTVAAE